MKTWITVASVALAVGFATGCGNTWEGIKKDSSALGKKVEKTGENVYIKNDEPKKDEKK
jgi:predicted small secreted protein